MGWFVNDAIIVARYFTLCTSAPLPPPKQPTMLRFRAPTSPQELRMHQRRMIAPLHRRLGRFLERPQMPSPHEAPRLVLILKRDRPSDPRAARIVPDFISVVGRFFALHCCWLVCIRVIFVFQIAAATGVDLLDGVFAVQERPRHASLAPVAHEELLHLAPQGDEAFDPEEDRAAGFVHGLREFRVAVVAEQASEVCGEGPGEMEERALLGGRAEGVVLDEGVDVFPLEEHAIWGWHGGGDGGWGVGMGEVVEVSDVVMVGARVGWVGEDEEVVGFWLEGLGVAAGDYWEGLISFGGWDGVYRGVGVPLK